MRRGFAPGFLNYKKGALDSQSQVIKFTSCLPRVGGFSPGTPASSNTKTGRHDIAEILLKVALKHQKINQSIIFNWLINCSILFVERSSISKSKSVKWRYLKRISSLWFAFCWDFIPVFKGFFCFFVYVLYMSVLM
jgi:hypothetical protein